MAVRRSYTAIVERNVLWQGDFASEPYEAAWASEAIFFVRTLRVSAGFAGGTARVQISADGMHWADEGTELDLPAQADAVAFCRIRHFGGWLRLRGRLEQGAGITVLVSLSLKE